MQPTTQSNLPQAQEHLVNLITLASLRQDQEAIDALAAISEQAMSVNDQRLNDLLSEAADMAEQRIARIRESGEQEYAGVLDSMGRQSAGDLTYGFLDMLEAAKDELMRRPENPRENLQPGFDAYQGPEPPEDAFLPENAISQTRMALEAPGRSVDEQPARRGDDPASLEGFTPQRVRDAEAGVDEMNRQIEQYAGSRTRQTDDGSVAPPDTVATRISRDMADDRTPSRGQDRSVAGQTRPEGPAPKQPSEGEPRSIEGQQRPDADLRSAFDMVLDWFDRQVDLPGEEETELSGPTVDDKVIEAVREARDNLDKTGPERPDPMSPDSIIRTAQENNVPDPYVEQTRRALDRVIVTPAEQRAGGEQRSIAGQTPPGDSQEATQSNSEDGGSGEAQARSMPSQGERRSTSGQARPDGATEPDTKPATGEPRSIDTGVPDRERQLLNLVGKLTKQLEEARKGAPSAPAPNRRPAAPPMPNADKTARPVQEPTAPMPRPRPEQASQPAPQPQEEQSTRHQNPLMGRTMMGRDRARDRFGPRGLMG